jgi:hypothetical protein
MEQPEQYQLIQMVNHTMVFIARCFLIPATLQFIVITRYYASLRLAGNKNQRTLNPIQLRFLGLILESTLRAHEESRIPHRLVGYALVIRIRLIHVVRNQTYRCSAYLSAQSGEITRFSLH